MSTSKIHSRFINSIFCLSFIFSLCVAQIHAFRPASAAVSGSAWQAGDIIDDPIFYDSSDMTADQVQQFLNSKVPSCDTWGTQTSEYGGGTRAQYGTSRGYAPPYICLRDYYENPTSHATNLNGDPVPGGISAAQIIKQSADTYSISVRVLLSILQKESAGPLITDTWPFPSQYRNAMGYGCPDTAPCDPSYAGFYNQVNNAARQFVLYKNNPNSYRHKALQDNAVLYNPSSSCGAGSVYIKSYATAGLYNYTPYQPNQAALNNMYGTGDSCSAYGNRNFWRIFNDWFGTTLTNDTSVPHPDGTLISYNGAVYFIENNSRHLVGAAAFISNGYRWENVKPATFGDKNLPETWTMLNLAAGSLFRTSSSGVYVSVYENNAWVKQAVTYEAYLSLGYNWSQVQVVSDNDLPVANTTAPLSPTAHPNGTLIKTTGGKVYHIDGNTLRYVSAPVFTSHHWSWDAITPATQADLGLPAGADELYQKGTILSDGSNLYVVSLPPSGPAIKNPIGPWTCYANAFHYSLSDYILVPTAALPASTGPLYSC